MKKVSGRAVVAGVRPWKRWQIDSFLRHTYKEIRYAGSPGAALREQAARGGELLIWASREPADFAGKAAAQGADVVRIEDGFLRSVGLGSQHVGGASLVIDRQGIYFDARRPSALETLLQNGAFDAALLLRAAALREQIVRANLDKYNVGARQVPALGGEGRRRVLVPGQVEDDASIRYGAGAVNTNLALLRAVRAAEPEAWIVYKPHPDTEAGARAGALADAEVLRHADQVVRGVSAGALLARVDAVHTMTSLLGFEALLRGVSVTTYGAPFYAGWGLTSDLVSHPRRTHARTLDELVAATLILYPSYVHPQTRARCEAEEVVGALSAMSAERPAASPARRALQLARGLYRSWVSAHG